MLNHRFVYFPGPGLVMEWQQHSQTLLVAGNARCVRLWDACTERKLIDISTGSLIMSIFKLLFDECFDSNPFFYYLEAECAATCVSRNDRLAACGFIDGSLRIWSTNSNRLNRVFRDHQAPLIQAFICADGRTLVSGW